MPTTEVLELKARLAVEEAHGEKYQRELRELRARLAEVARDAARYRWLRDVSEDDSVVALPAQEWDAAIDAEIAAGSAVDALSVCRHRNLIGACALCALEPDTSKGERK